MHWDALGYVVHTLSDLGTGFWNLGPSVVDTEKACPMSMN